MLSPEGKKVGGTAAASSVVLREAETESTIGVTSRVSTTLDDGRHVGVEVTTGYPYEGKVSIRVIETDAEPWALSLRVPEWATAAWLIDRDERRQVGPGMASVERVFAMGDQVELELPVRARWTVPDPRIDSIRGCVAVERGPLVLCVESVDLPDESNVDMVRIDFGGGLDDGDGRVTAGGRLIAFENRVWPYPGPTRAPVAGGEATLSLTPYHRWATRGPSTMRVWIPTVE